MKNNTWTELFALSQRYQGKITIHYLDCKTGKIKVVDKPIHPLNTYDLITATINDKLIANNTPLNSRSSDYTLIEKSDIGLLDLTFQPTTIKQIVGMELGDIEKSPNTDISKLTKDEISTLLIDMGIDIPKKHTKKQLIELYNDQLTTIETTATE